MKNKMLLFAFLVFFITEKSLARTPRISKKQFTYETLKLPLQKLPNNLAYSLVLQTSPEFAFNALQSEHAMQIPGWIKNKNVQDYDVEVQFYPIQFLTPELNTRCQVIKDSSGITIDTLYFYKNVYRAQTMANVRMLFKDEQEIFSGSTPDAFALRDGREFSNKIEARREAFKEARRIEALLIQDLSKQLTQGVNHILDMQFGVYPIIKRNNLLIVRNKKHEEYNRMQLLWNHFNRVRRDISVESNLNEVRNDLMQNISYLKSLSTKYKSQSKEDRKMRHIANYNLAIIALVLEQPDDALYYTREMEKINFNKNDTRQIVLDAKQMKQIFLVQN